MALLLVFQHEMSMFVGANVDTDDLKINRINEDYSFHPRTFSNGDKMKINRFGGDQSFLPRALNNGEEMKINRFGESFHHRAFNSQDELKRKPKAPQNTHVDASTTFDHPATTETLDLKHLVHGRRHRRSYSLKSKCFPSFVKMCKIFTVNGITKPYCVHVKKLLCVALD